MCARTPVAGAKRGDVRSLESFFQASPSPGWIESTGMSNLSFRRRQRTKIHLESLFELFPIKSIKVGLTKGTSAQQNSNFPC